MEFSEKISSLANRSHHAAKHALTEEATKTAVVLPLIQALGFDIFNLEEVIPEFIADVGIKKGEKIDFAIVIGGAIRILIEAKPISTSLGSAQYSQLFRYFGTTEARLAILTNGREIWFFSDIEEPNMMDKKPFFVFNLQNYDEGHLAELSRFEKIGFDFAAIREAASNLRYVKSAANLLTKQLDDPDDEFVRYFAKHIYEGSIPKAVLEQFRPAITQALDEIIRKRIQDRLNVTFGKDQIAEPINDTLVTTPESAEAETTEDEQMAFLIVRAIASKLITPDRVAIRDSKSYCAVFVDDNNRKPICRFCFNAKSVKYIGLFSGDKQESRHQIEGVNDLYKYCVDIEKAVTAYL